MAFNYQKKDPRRVIIYCRVSGDAQEDNTSLEQQEKDCRALAAERDLIVVDVIYEVFTGTVWKERKKFMQMRERYLAGECDSIMIRTFDRLTRVAAHFFIIREELREQGINLLCAKESLPEDPTLAEAMITLKMSFAQKEREKIVDRVQTGKIARVTEQKRYLGGYKPPFGYRFDDPVKKNKLLVYEPEAAVVRKVLEMRAERRGILYITQYLVDHNILSPNGKRDWSSRTVRAIIERSQTLYRGIAYAYKNVNTKEFRDDRWVAVRRKVAIEDQLPLPEGTVERMISDELAAKIAQVNDIMTQEAARNNKHEVTAILRAGFAICAYCGSTMTIYHDHRIKSGPSARYRCCSHNRPGLECPGVEIQAEVLDAAVWAFVCGKIDDLSEVDKAITRIMKKGNLDSAVKSGLKAVEDQRALVDQYRNDLKNARLTAPARAILLEDLNTQAEVLEKLEFEVEDIKALQASRGKVLEDYKQFRVWRAGFIAGGGTEPDAPYKTKRDGLRFMGTMVRVFKAGSEKRFEVTCDPTNLLKYLRLLVSEGEEAQEADADGSIGSSMCQHGTIKQRIGDAQIHFIQASFTMRDLADHRGNIYAESC